MPRLEEATTISPGQSSSASLQNSALGKCFQCIMCCPVRTAAYSLLYAVALTERWYVGSYPLPRALPWADSSWAFSPTTTLPFKSTLAFQPTRPDGKHFPCQQSVNRIYHSDDNFKAFNPPFIQCSFYPIFSLTGKNYFSDQEKKFL